LPMNILIRSGRIIDVASGIDLVGDMCISDGVITDIGSSLRPEKIPDEVIDAKDKLVLPGLVDIHVHLRDPGLTYKEDIESGTLAAAWGGFTTVAAMPNTSPAGDAPDTVKYVLDKSNKVGYCRVLPVAAITIGQKGETLCDLDSLFEAGAAAYSDDGRPVENSRFMREALKKAAQHGIPVLSHCEDMSLTDEGVINEGEVSKLLGVKGIPDESESLAVARDIALAEILDLKVHICHVSTESSVEMIRAAKIRGVKVTAETCPHYFTLTDKAVLTYGANAKMNPPLGSEQDLRAVIAGLADGTIDAITTDHAPHSKEEKSRGLEKSPSGIIGLETALALSLTKLYREGNMPLKDVLYKMTAAPAGIMGIDAGRLNPGVRADITVIDPDEEWTVDVSKFKSKSKNCPYHGMKLYGRVKYTICGGKITCQSQG
jgi:dihydroorotase